MRLRAQLLDGREPGLGVPGVVARLLAVQAQDRAAFPLALRARLPGLTAADVASALEARSVVRTWAMRGTLHLVCAEDHGWLLPLVGAPRLPAALRRVEQVGLAREAPDRVVAWLGADGPLSRAELAARLGVSPAVAVHAVRAAALRGEVVCAPPGDRFALARDWIGSSGRDAGLHELALRYLRAHGDAEPEDLAHWAGIGLRDARAAWPGAPPAAGEAPPGVVRLLPSWDEWLLGWRSREWTLAAEHTPRVFPGGGWLHPVVVVDGRVAGVWGSRGVELFGDVDPRAVEAELADVARFRAPPEPR